MAKRGRIAAFIEPMECLPVEKIPEGEPWTYELKLDGYRLIAVKAAGRVTLYSRRGTDLSKRFEDVAAALASLPDETVLDGELVALDEQGKPNFNLLQNFRSADSHIMFYAFDVLVRRGEDLTNQTLSKRREILESTMLIGGTLLAVVCLRYWRTHQFIFTIVTQCERTVQCAWWVQVQNSEKTPRFPLAQLAAPLTHFYFNCCATSV